MPRSSRDSRSGIVRRSQRSWLLLLIARVFQLSLGLLVFGIVGRALGSEELLRFLFYLAVFGISSMLTLAGFQEILLRELGQGRASGPLQQALAARACRRGWLAGLGWLLLVLAFRDAGDLCLALCAIPHLFLPLKLAASTDLLEGQSRTLAFSEVAGRVVLLLSCGLLAILGANTAGAYALAFCIAPIVATIPLLRSCESGLRVALLSALFRPFGKGDGGALARAERDVALGNCVRMLYLQGPHLVLRTLHEASYLAFASASRVFQSVLLVPSSLSTVIQGPLSKGSVEARDRLARKSYPKLTLLGCIVGALLFFPAELWLRVLFPGLGDLAQAAVALRYFALSLPAIFGASLLLPLLLSTGRERQALRASILGLLAAGIVIALPSSADRPFVAAHISGALAAVASEWTVFLCCAWQLVPSKQRSLETMDPAIEEPR